MHIRFLTVPKNEEGIVEYDMGVESSDNLNVYYLPEEEFENLWVAFNVINYHCELLIDDYESEIIKGQDLEKCKEILLEMKVKGPMFFQALDEAIRYNTLLALDF